MIQRKGGRMMKQALVSVFGKDQPGIISGVTQVLFKNQVNLEDISMTVLEGEFAMMMIVNPKANKAADGARSDFERYCRRHDLTGQWKEMKRRLRPGAKHARGSRSYIVTAAGTDKTGIVYTVSRYFATKKMNITDLNSKIVPGRRGELYILMLEVDVPAGVTQSRLEKGVSGLAKKLGIDIQVRPVEAIQF